MTSAHDAPLPTGTHLLHLGPTKTGSTTLQNALYARQQELHSHGVCYPGNRPKQQEAFADLLGWPPNNRQTRRDKQESDLVARQIDQAENLRVVLSSERLGRCSLEHARRVVERFGGSQPHVVAAARRYDRFLPSQWQQQVRQLTTQSYEAWLEELLPPPASTEPLSGGLWTAHATMDLARRWGSLVGLKNTTIMLTSETDRTFLTNAFESMLGLPTGLLSTVRVRSNQSFGYEEIELLRQWSCAFQRTENDLELRVQFVQQAARKLEKLPRASTRVPYPALPVWTRPVLDELSEQRIDGLRALQDHGLRIIGDLDSLRIPDTAFEDGNASGMTSFSQVEVERVFRALSTTSLAAHRKQKAHANASVTKLKKKNERLRARLADRRNSTDRNHRPLHHRVLRKLRRR